jgi:deoxyribodipyrimidine photo-lyase
MHRRALHIFRRDLRLEDNTALGRALATSREVVTAFILDDTQVGAHPYRSANGLAFMIESLEALAEAIAARGGRLLTLHGSPSQVVASLIAEFGIDAVFFNRDYTPFSLRRDAAIAEVCAGRGVACLTFDDALLVDPQTFAKDDGRPYTVFTPFYRKASQREVRKPAGIHAGTFARADDYRGDIVKPRAFWPETSAPTRLSHGGRATAMAILKAIRTFADYERHREHPAENGTTHLAPHHKFGTISIRETYRAVASTFNASHTLIRELYWRDFFTHIAWHFPHVFSGAFHAEYDRLAWVNRPDHLAAWCEGRTGFPLVDAGMRELVATGFMHNRVRMVVASFLVKDLHISWRKGEAFFAQHLTDYDPAVNNGSWQWAASTGCDAQPYFRVFNPWLQQERYDPDCRYIHRWVPELRGLTPREVHALHTPSLTRLVDYPSPIVDHAAQKAAAVALFTACRAPGREPEARPPARTPRP